MTPQDNSLGREGGGGELSDIVAPWDLGKGL